MTQALRADPAVVAELLRPSPILATAWAADEYAKAARQLISVPNDPDNRPIREACQQVYDSAKAHLIEVLGNG